MPARDFVRLGIVREIAGQERLKSTPGRQRSLDPLSIPVRQLWSRDRGRQVGHHDCSSENAGRIRQDRSHDLAIAQMGMPVVRTADGDSLQGSAHLR